MAKDKHPAGMCAGMEGVIYLANNPLVFALSGRVIEIVII